MTPAELRFRSDLDAAAAAGDRTGWLAIRGIYADWLVDQDRDREADEVRELMQFPLESVSDWPAVAGLQGLSDHQRSVAARCLVRPLGILTGSPGTGKTRVAASLIAALARRPGLGRVAVCAPTGKAAVRIHEALDRYTTETGIPVGVEDPRTIHSLLRIARAGYDGNGWEFDHTPTNPLPYRYLIVEEASMLDTDLAAALLSACAPGTHVLLVGDTGQLPPVGHGSPLRDLISAGVPCGELTEIHRNAGLIVKACRDIRYGNSFELASRYEPIAGVNLKHIERRYPAEILTAIREVITAFQRSGKFNPLWDLQVICPLNERGPLARERLNAFLQGLLNPLGAPGPGGGRLSRFRVRDKIACLRNGWHPTDDNDHEYIANGDVGMVNDIDNRQVFAQFGRRSVVLAGEALEDFDLGYAITAHRSQGSEWPVVIVIVDPSPGANFVCGREWWYTAISRARELCITIGVEDRLRKQALTRKLERRKTFLTEFIEAEDIQW